MTDEITLRGMRFDARVGILPRERAASQPIEVDLRVLVETGDGILDYRDLYDVVATVLGSGHIDFIEEVCHRVATATLAHSPRVRRVRVAVRKPSVSLPGPLDYAEAAVELDSPANTILPSSPGHA